MRTLILLAALLLAGCNSPNQDTLPPCGLWVYMSDAHPQEALSLQDVERTAPAILEQIQLEGLILIPCDQVVALYKQAQIRERCEIAYLQLNQTYQASMCQASVETSHDATEKS